MSSARPQAAKTLNQQRQQVRQAANGTTGAGAAKPAFKTCLWLLTSTDGCRRGDACKLSHNHAEIVKEYSLVRCANLDDCVAVTEMSLQAPLLTNPRYGATCAACRDAAARRVRQSQTPCRWFGRSTAGCRKGDACEFLHDRELAAQHYELHKCPNSQTKWGCVNKIEPNLCAGRMCAECHGAMIDRRDRAQQQREAREAREARDARQADVPNAPDADEREWLPCKARDSCPNLAQGNACDECVQMYRKHVATMPAWRRAQRAGRLH